jgi:UDP-N-acetylmuramoyl-tripeptide--D-alanyl-D-alanine ligase
VVNLNEIITALTDHRLPALNVPVSSVVIDSRQATLGSLFIALPGERVDGHAFVEAAFQNGASLALIHQESAADLRVLDLRPGHFQPEIASLELPLCIRVADTLQALQNLAAHQRQQHPLRTIGITGSVGKTSTKELTASLLSEKYRVLKNTGNRNNEIGLPLTLLTLEPYHERAVLEMGFYVPGEIRTLCNIAKPHVGVVSNIGTVHAERAGSQEAIARGKAELVEELPPGPEGVAVLNKDDPWVRGMAEKTRADVLFYGLDQTADLFATDVKSHGLEGISCVLHDSSGRHPIRSPMLGAFSVYTILRAAAVARVEALPWDAITEALAKSQVTLRMQKRELSNGAILLDDTYNASPSSTTAALNLLRDLQGRRLAILGDMLELGQYEKEGHTKVGQVAAEAADLIILVGERSKTTAAALRKSGFPEENLHWFPDSDAAAEKARTFINEGDVILIKGSNSMRMEKILRALEGNG